MAWYIWCDSTAATTSNITTVETWDTWTDTSVTTSSATGSNTNIIWIRWTSATETTANDTSSTIDVTGNRFVDARTPEQRAADEARHAAMLARQLADRDRQQAARDKAWRLLVAMLDHQQREQLERERFFEVVAHQSRRRYRIRHGTHGNVRLLDDQGREVTSYCAQPLNVPAEDAMLAQKLMLESDEDAYLKVANATPLRRTG